MTPEDGLRLQIEGYRRMTPQQRLAVSFELYQLSRSLVRQGAKAQHPDWDEPRVNAEVARRFRLGARIP
jgi:hypothetical protein